MKTAWVTVAVPCTLTVFRRRLLLERDLEAEMERIRGVDSESLMSGNPVDNTACSTAVASSSLSSSSSSRSSPA